jgi:hypothetical protein
MMMAWQDQRRRQRAAIKRGRRGARRAMAAVLRRVFGPAARSGQIVLPIGDEREI